MARSPCAKKLENLTIKSTYTTNNGGSNDGAISITCVDEDGNEVVLRTVVMLNSDGTLITEDAFPVGAKIAYAKGIVDAYDGKYQLKIFRPVDIVFAD